MHENMCPHKKTCINVHSSLIAKNSKQPEYPSVAKETNNSVRTTTVHHTVEYYSAMKGNKSLIHATTLDVYQTHYVKQRKPSEEYKLYSSTYLKP